MEAICIAKTPNNIWKSGTHGVIIVFEVTLHTSCSLTEGFFLSSFIAKIGLQSFLGFAKIEHKFPQIVSKS